MKGIAAKVQRAVRNALACRQALRNWQTLPVLPNAQTKFRMRGPTLSGRWQKQGLKSTAVRRRVSSIPAMESKNSHENALQFLQGIEQRHDHVLEELEQLNGRIEDVLGEYLNSREQAPQATDGERVSVS